MAIYTCYPGGKAKALTMNYDDGRTQDIRLVEIFNRYGIKGTFNLNYGSIARNVENRVSAAQIKELYEGHEVATHAVNHPTLERCPITEIVGEIMEDRKGLETLTGTLVRGHAYPNGSFTDEIKALLPHLGIAYARAWEGTYNFEMPRDLYEWRPTCHHADPQLMPLAEEFANFKKDQYLMLMMVVGHSYEFDLKNNWQVMEDFCKYMGGRDDIWYATCIEIIDYLDAAKRLQFSADHKTVYNPSAQSVWIQNWITSTEKTIYEIAPGATVPLD